MQCEQSNGDILFVYRGDALSVSYGDTERDIASLKRDIIAIFIASEGCLYLNNSNGFTTEQKIAAEQIEVDYKDRLRCTEGGNAAVIENYFE